MSHITHEESRGKESLNLYKESFEWSPGGPLFM